MVHRLPEKVELKRSVFKEIGMLADAVHKPERFFNFNWGNPADVRVEVMGHPGTAPGTIEGVMAFLKKLGIVALQVKCETMGYGCNRIWRAVKKEVLFLIEGGYMSPEDIDWGWMFEWETDVDPCGVMDYIGLDVIRDIELNYFKASAILPIGLLDSWRK
jgi:3-hydroxyacyl-CoA dehydrogenase